MYRSLSHGGRPANFRSARRDGPGPAAINIAVTSGLPADRMLESAAVPGAAGPHQDDSKNSHLGMAAACQTVGVAFLPSAAEAHGGGLGLTARRVSAKAAAAYENEAAEVGRPALRGVSAF